MDVLVIVIRFMRVFAGLLLIAIAIFALVAYRMSAEAGASGIETLRQVQSGEISTASPDVFDPGLDGRLVYLQGPLEAVPITDPLTGVTVEAGGLRRIVEMEQWHRVLGGSRIGSRPKFERVWSDRVIPVDNKALFGEDYVNPDSIPYPPEDFPSQGLRVGVWQLSEYYGWRASGQWQLVPFELLAESDTVDGWRFASCCIYDEKWNVQTDGIGDVRIRYEYLPVEKGVYSVLGVPRDGVLDYMELFGERSIGVPLIEPGSVDAAAMIDRVVEIEEPGERYGRGWLVWIFLGVLLALRPLTLPFSFLRGFWDAPIGKRLLMTLAVAIILSIAAWELI